jgi:hypothetical protein
MKLTYAITVCNEFAEIQRLVAFLLQHKRPQDNIVVLYDEANGDPNIETFLRTHSINAEFSWHKAKFQGHFADWKNKLSSLCSGDYIFQLDADEMVDEYQCRLIPQVIESNEVDVIRVPRINTVKGLTADHVSEWDWQVNEYGWINFPDYQWRIYRNSDKIFWEGKVHERLIGYTTIAHLPAGSDWALTHHKTIERQVKQNNYYNTL